MLIISVCASKQGDIFSSYLEKAFIYQGYPVKICSFAYTFKASLCVALGLSEEQIWGSLKDVEDSRLKCTPRKVFKTIEQSLKTIDEDIWIKCPLSPIEIAKRTNKIVLIPDNEYSNETNAIKSNGGYTVRLQNSFSLEHPSCDCDEILWHDGSVKDLEIKASQTVDKVLTLWKEDTQKADKLVKMTEQFNQHLKMLDQEFLNVVERKESLCNLLKIHRGNISAVARKMGYSRMQVHRWVKRYDLDLKSFRLQKNDSKNPS